jgi:hypothetical protein
MITTCPKCGSEDTASFQVIVDEKTFTTHGGIEATLLLGLARKIHPGQYPVWDIAIAMIGVFFFCLFWYFTTLGGNEFAKGMWLMAAVAVFGTPLAFWLSMGPRKKWKEKRDRIPIGWMCKRCGSDWDQA